MKTRYQKVLCVAVLLGSAVTVSAQEDANKKKLDREMTLEREYAPTVQDANKVNTLPQIKEPKINKRPISYSPFTLAADPEKQLFILPSGDFMTQMDYNKRRGYLNAAAGMNLNINGDFGYHILSTDKDKLNIFFSHRSTNGNVKYIQNNEKVKAKLNDNIGGLNFAHSFNRAILNLGVSYNYTGFNYYGMPLDITGDVPDMDAMSTTDRKTNQVNQAIKANIGVEAHEDASAFYMIDVDYVNFSHKYGLSPEFDGPTEHTIGAKFNFRGNLADNQQVGVEGMAEYYAYSFPKTEMYEFENHAEVTASPYYRIFGDNWNVKLGAKVMYVSGEHDSFTASPNIAADVEVADQTVLYLKADGRLHSNSAYEISRINRYANPNLEIAPTRDWLDGQFGLKCGVAPGFWFDIFAGYQISSDQLQFIPSPGFSEGYFGNLPTAVPGIDTKKFFAGINLKYSYQNFLDINLRGKYNNWKGTYNDRWFNTEDIDKDVEHVYNQPKMELQANVTVKPIDKLAIDVNYYLGTDRYTCLGAAGDTKMKNINELNFQASYNINKTFGVYAKVSNLLNQKYEIYWGYPNQGINIMGGVNINF